MVPDHIYGVVMSRDACGIVVTTLEDRALRL